MARDRFVELVTEGLPPPPAYFPHDAELNRRGAAPLEERRRVPRLAADAVLRLVQDGAVLLDVRADDAFRRAHVPGALHIGLGGSFASWAGSLLPPDAAILLVGDAETEVDEAIVRLARVGLDHVMGALEGGFAAWTAAARPAAAIATIEPADLHARLGGAGVHVLDVRGAAEHAAGHIPGAIHVPVAELARRRGALPAGGPIYVACASGYRSLIAASLLARLGVEGVVELSGGHQAWAQAGLPLTPPTASAGAAPGRAPAPPR